MLFARLNEGRHRLQGSAEEPELLPVKVGVAAYTMTMDLAAARQHLGYQPQRTTDDAIQAFARWWLSGAARTSRG